MTNKPNIEYRTEEGIVLSFAPAGKLVVLGTDGAQYHCYTGSATFEVKHGDGLTTYTLFAPHATVRVKDGQAELITSKEVETQHVTFNTDPV